jgi:hypothetical protein
MEYLISHKGMGMAKVSLFGQPLRDTFQPWGNVTGIIDGLSGHFMTDCVSFPKFFFSHLHGQTDFIRYTCTNYQKQVNSFCRFNSCTETNHIGYQLCDCNRSSNYCLLGFVILSEELISHTNLFVGVSIYNNGIRWISFL